MADNAKTRETIAQTVQTYVDGMIDADADKLRSAMHPKACSIGHFDKGLEWDDRETFIAGVAANYAPPESRYCKIRSIEVIGDTARVVVEDDYLGMRFTDSLCLLRHEGRWLIVSKVFWLHPDAGQITAEA